MTLRLFHEGPLAPDSAFALSAEAARHAQVRRVQPGDGVCLFNNAGGEWQAEVTQMTRSSVSVRVLAHVAVERELPWAVTLAVGMPAGERMDWLVEKATELGVQVIQPLLCERSVLRVQGERAERKREHWQAVAVAAAEQCGRTLVPQVAPVCSLATLWAAAQGQGQRWLLSLQEGATLPQRPALATPLTLLSGPEGGFAPAEAEAAQRAGWQPISLGPRVLRAETAPLAVLAWLSLSI
jgi:16S rRNA (uracil1498-N3)-methyltransferase